MSSPDDRRRPAFQHYTPSRTSSQGSSSSSSSLKQLRTPRFAEATSIHSPVDGRGPFADPQEATHAQPADVGFGYIGENTATKESSNPTVPMTPLKSAMKVPGTPARRIENPLSPTFREEEILGKREQDTEKEQAKDLAIKTRVRFAKFALRGVNFSCSLIILSMLTSSFAIFNATKALPPQNGLPPWAENTNSWPQKVVLAAACLNLFICVLIFIGYCRGGHHRAEKVGVYYTLFAVGWFIFNMIIWAIAAGVLQFTRNNSGNKDMWGWACVQNHRSEVFSDKVDYALVCRLQNWTLICIIIEVVIEVISISLYSVIFYRYYTKRRLAKSMDMRDRARSDLYLAQLRSQSAPNTPGFGPKSPAFSQYALSPRFPPSAYKSLGEISEQPAQPSFTPANNVAVPESSFAQAASPQSESKPFSLQAPPKKAPRATPANGVLTTPVTPTAPVQNFDFVAPGEQQYAAVPIPGAYADAANKPVYR
ncbi:hypothetical protein PG996_000808 [Apiospora saccharicola]|uniref:MARVEL domain-containing protein n=1 Tax=Apiospora saccharicola TaxID=335842 RepID=A0ABR1WG97_9PEZI